MPFAFIDFETQSLADLPEVGTLNYVLDASTRPLLLSWAVDDGPTKLWCPDLGPELVPEVWAYVQGRMAVIETVPPDLVELLVRPDGYLIAWNAAFDRQTWQQVATPDFGFPDIRIEQTLDAMAQAQASNLPGRLDWAGRKLGLGGKTQGGKGNMLRFARRGEPLPGSPADIEALMAKGRTRQQAIDIAIEAWALYLDYSVQDTDLLRDVWRCTRPLDAAEWQEYWVSERINDRGMLADLDVCRGAMAYREEETEFVAEECRRLTRGVIDRPSLTAQINKWLYDNLSHDLAAHMVKERDPNTGEPTRLSAGKPVLTRLLEEIYVSDTPPDDSVTDFIELLQFGRSSSAVKFEKILNQSCGGRLCGSYVFNGAGQTGRLSSRGVQIHNLPRDKVPNELDVLDMVAARVPIEELRKLPLSKDDAKKEWRSAEDLRKLNLPAEEIRERYRGDTSVNAMLARLIRPVFHAPEDKLLVWGDWSAIEARVTPWLAKSRDAERTVLEPFRQSDADPSVPDVYVLNAAVVFNMDAAVLWDRYKNNDPEAYNMRQGGKVMTLSLAFRGSVGALRAMAKNYKIRLTNEEGKYWVDGWRDRNRWNKRYGEVCEEAAFSAVLSPGSRVPAGRLTYEYAPGLMGGTLVCFLPDGRPITYPMARIEKIEKFGKDQDAITYLNGMGRRSLWDGLQIENGTQATAASILRGTMVRLEERHPYAPVVLDTHDEVGCEVETAKASGFAETLEHEMVRGFDWTEGLPLAAEVMVDWYYHK